MDSIISTPAGAHTDLVNGTDPHFDPASDLSSADLLTTFLSPVSRARLLFKVLPCVQPKFSPNYGPSSSPSWLIKRPKGWLQMPCV